MTIKAQGEIKVKGGRRAAIFGGPKKKLEEAMVAEWREEVGLGEWREGVAVEEIL